MVPIPLKCDLTVYPKAQGGLENCDSGWYDKDNESLSGYPLEKLVSDKFKAKNNLAYQVAINFKVPTIDVNGMLASYTESGVWDNSVCQFMKLQSELICSWFPDDDPRNCNVDNY